MTRLIRIAVLIAAGCSSVLVVSCATNEADSRSEHTADFRPASVDHVVPSPLWIGTFPQGSDRVSDALADRGDALRSISSFRLPLPPEIVTKPISKEVNLLLARAAEALARNESPAAIAAAEEAVRLEPTRIEPLELLLLARLSRGETMQVREILAKISALDSRNTIGVAFRGLEAVQQGRVVDALALLSWLVGPDALPRRGASIPLPTGPGEIEEQAGICALELNANAAALACFNEALRMRATDVEATRRVQLLRADALVGLGQLDDAAILLASIAQTTSQATSQATLEAALESTPEAQLQSTRSERGGVDLLAMLASMRLDAVDNFRGRADEPLRRALATFSQLPHDDFAMYRLLESARDASLHERSQTIRALLNSVSDRTLDARGRVELAALLLDRGRLATDDGRSELEALLRANVDDQAAVRGALRVLCARDLGKAVALVGDLVRTHPNELDTLANGLLASGVDIDRLLAAINADGRAPECDALRSRMLARFGFVEEGLAVAEVARARDPASACVLAAAALCAAELDDESLVSEIDDVVTAAGCGVCPTLATCWAMLEDVARARDRAARANAQEPSRDVDAPTERLVDRVLAAAQQLEGTRLPLFQECLALADELDPSSPALDRLAARAGTAAAPPGLMRWAQHVARETPALPSRRKLVLFLEQRPPALSIPAAPWSARFDAACTASTDVRQAEARTLARMRPRTPEALAALARAELALGKPNEAAAIVIATADSTTALVNARAARALLLVAGEVARRAPAQAVAMQGLAAGLVEKLGRTTPREMLAAMSLAVVTRAETKSIEQLASVLAGAARPPTSTELPEYFDLFAAVKSVDEDPFPAAILAEALARETRFEPEVRARFGASAVALFAASGGAEDRSGALARSLVETGAAPFMRRGETSGGVGRAILRAADLHALIGDAAGSQSLLEMAVRESPDSPEALNNLAYIDVERGTITDRTIEMVERAAAGAPDNPAILDTIGLLRLDQGRLRDGAGGPGAITLFRQALRLKPDDPSLQTLDHLGDALWRDGDQQGAIRCWQQVGQIAALRYPPEPIARSLLEYQQREFGVPLVNPVEYVKRMYGDVVDRADRKLEQVAAGSAPSVRGSADSR